MVSKLISKIVIIFLFSLSAYAVETNTGEKNKSASPILNTSSLKINKGLTQITKKADALSEDKSCKDEKADLCTFEKAPEKKTKKN